MTNSCTRWHSPFAWWHSQDVLWPSHRQQHWNQNLFSRRNTGLGSMRHVASGQAGKLNLTGCCSMPYLGNTQLRSAHIQLTTSSQWATLRTFIGWGFVGNCAIRNSHDGSKKFSTSNRAAVTKPDWWGLGSRQNYGLWQLVISFVCVCIMFLIISILLILFPS